MKDSIVDEKFGFFGIYRGVVEDNNPKDPITNELCKDGRIKVRVWGLHTELKIKTTSSNPFEGIPTDDLPLAYPAYGLIEGSMSGFGLWSVPLQGSQVLVFFEAGNHMKPIYFATVPGIPRYKPDINIGFNDPDGVYPTEHRLNESDFHRLARDVNADTVHTTRTNNREQGVTTAKGGTWDEPEPTYDTEYPHNIVFATHGGIVIEVDSTDTKQRLHIYHPSNTFIEINADGDMIIKNKGDKYNIVGGDKNELVNFNSHETVKTNKTIKVEGDMNIEVIGTANIKASTIKLN